MTHFGTPQTDDMTGRQESALNSAETRLRKFASLMEELVPRALGSKPVSPQDEFSEYVLTAADSTDPVSGYADRLREFIAQKGRDQGFRDWKQWVKRNEKRLLK
jgi:hypothetical protein